MNAPPPKRTNPVPAVRSWVGQMRKLFSQSLENRWLAFIVCVALAAITFAVFGQTWQFDFVNYDDNACVYENPAVTHGLSLAGMVAVFSHYHYGNWIPLETVSHMADWQLYGANAGGHHLTSVLLHAASVVVLFLVLRCLTGALWRSALVAAVFAVHPLHVESVAWVSERKDVLSGLFFMLTLGAYVRYVRNQKSLFNYLIVVFLFAFGLLSKPMLVTLPFILLLLDYWPLNRFATDTSAKKIKVIGALKNVSIPARLLLEKIPLLLLSVVSGVTTMQAQSPTVQSLQAVSFPLRVENAAVSCVIYVWQLFYPANLAAFYPYPVNGLPFYQVIAALILLIAISLGAFLWRRKCPYFFVGWWWYLIMLAPVIGIVQVGMQARADRYTYLPQIGLCILVVWFMEQAGARLTYRRTLLGLGAGLGLGALMATAHTQTAYWRNSESLWTHALACTENNSVAQDNLGFFLFRAGQPDVAISHFQTALKIHSDDDSAENNYGLALVQQGHVDAAAVHFQKAVKFNPDNDDAQNNFGNVLYMNGQVDAAIGHYQKALQANPGNAKAANNLGLALASKGRMDEAIACFQRAVAIDPDYAEAGHNLQLALVQKAQTSQTRTDHSKQP